MLKLALVAIVVQASRVERSVGGSKSGASAKVANHGTSPRDIDGYVINAIESRLKLLTIRPACLLSVSGLRWTVTGYWWGVYGQSEG